MCVCVCVCVVQNGIAYVTGEGQKLCFAPYIQSPLNPLVFHWLSLHPAPAHSEALVIVYALMHS